MPRALRSLSADRVLVDTLRLSDAEWYECVSEMDRVAAQSASPSDPQQDERVPYRNSPHIMIEMRTHDGRQQLVKVRPYDLSESGIGFLNGAYMHVGTEIVLHLRHSEIGMTRIEATIRCCSHVKNTIHHVDADFKEPMQINEFLLAEASDRLA